MIFVLNVAMRVCDKITLPSEKKKKYNKQNSILETYIKLHCNSSSQIKIHTFLHKGFISKS